MATKKRLGFLPGWRKGTYIVLAFNLLMLIWVISAGASGGGTPDDCGSLSAQTCNDAESIGTGIGVAILIFLWALGDVILGVLWMVTNKRGRDCPVCGSNVKKGMTACKSCGHNFAAGFAQPAQ